MAQQMRVLGMDMAQLVLHVGGMDHTGHVVLRKRLARSALLHFMATLPPLRTGMEACGSAHDWARRFRAQGHDVRLIAPHFVKPSVKSPQNDRGLVNRCVNGIRRRPPDDCRRSA